MMKNLVSIRLVYGSLPYFLVIITVFIVSCSKNTTDYVPLGEKYIWEYHYQNKINDEHSVGKSIIAQLNNIKVNDIEYFPHRSANGEIYYYSRNDSGLYISANIDHERTLVLKYPLRQDASWKVKTGIIILDSRHESFSGGETFITSDEEIVFDTHIVKLNDIVKVTAGTFENCMLLESKVSVSVKERTRGIEHIIIEQKEWFAPGIGMVKKIRREYTFPEKYHGEQIIELVRLKRK